MNADMIEAVGCIVLAFFGGIWIAGDSIVAIIRAWKGKE